MPKIEIYSKKLCTFCKKAKELLQKHNYEYIEYFIDFDSLKKEDLIKKIPNVTTVPQIIINDKIIGGYKELKQWLKN